MPAPWAEHAQKVRGGGQREGSGSAMRRSCGANGAIAAALRRRNSNRRARARGGRSAGRWTTAGAASDVRGARAPARSRAAAARSSEGAQAANRSLRHHRASALNPAAACARRSLPQNNSLLPRPCQVVVEFTKSSGGVGRREIKLSHSAAAVPPQLNVSQAAWGPQAFPAHSSTRLLHRHSTQLPRLRSHRARAVFAIAAMHRSAAPRALFCSPVPSFTNQPLGRVSPET